ncbi:hypothetical protein BS17DRAFT_767553 [Gyrodon lividus]|nr:hypothetical protein BS17DRAFT_767553 [Gyrodon lividus]
MTPRPTQIPVPGWKGNGHDIGWAKAIGFKLLISQSPPNCTPPSKTPTVVSTLGAGAGAPPTTHLNCFQTPHLFNGGTKAAATSQPLASTPSANHLKPTNTCRTTCAAHKCLQLWKPITLIADNPPGTVLTTLPESDQSWIKDMIAHTWAESTKESYGSEIEVLLKAATTPTPTSSKCKLCKPYTVDILVDAAVFACLTTTFWCTAQVGEFTIPHLDAFNPSLHVKCSNIMQEKDWQGLMVMNFFLPRMKSALLGEDIRMVPWTPKPPSKTASR